MRFGRNFREVHFGTLPVKEIIIFIGTQPRDTARPMCQNGTVIGNRKETSLPCDPPWVGSWAMS